MSTRAEEHGHAEQIGERITHSTISSTFAEIFRTTLEVHEYGRSNVSHPELRRAPRYRYQASLEIEWGSARLRAHTRDISAGGMFVEAEDVLWVGAAFRARLITEKPCWLECSVKRVEPGLGMGVTVELREDQSQRHYRNLLAKLAAHQ